MQVKKANRDGQPILTPGASARQTFGAQLEQLKAEWNTKIKRRVHPKSDRKIERGAAPLW
jgi:hypothetical protein